MNLQELDHKRHDHPETKWTLLGDSIAMCTPLDRTSDEFKVKRDFLLDVECWSYRWMAGLHHCSGTGGRKGFTALLAGATTTSLKWWALFVSVHNEKTSGIRTRIKRDILAAVEIVVGPDRRPSISEMAIRSSSTKVAKVLSEALVPTVVHLGTSRLVRDAITQVIVNANLVIKNLEHNNFYREKVVKHAISTENCAGLLSNAAAIFDAVNEKEISDGLDTDNTSLHKCARVALSAACGFFMFSLALNSKPSSIPSSPVQSRVLRLADEFEMRRLCPESVWPTHVITGWMVRSIRFMNTKHTFAELPEDVRVAIQVSVTELEGARNGSVGQRRSAAYATHLKLIDSCERWFKEKLELSVSAVASGHDGVDVQNYLQAFHTLHQEGVHDKFSKTVATVSQPEVDPVVVRAQIEREMGLSATEGPAQGGNIQSALKKYLKKVRMHAKKQPWVLLFFSQMFRDVGEEDRGFRIQPLSVDDHATNAARRHGQNTEDATLDKLRLQKINGDFAWMYPMAAVPETVDAIRRFNPGVMKHEGPALKHAFRNASSGAPSGAVLETPETPETPETSETPETPETPETLEGPKTLKGPESPISKDWWWERARDYEDCTKHVSKGPNTILSFSDDADAQKVSNAAAAFNVLQQLYESGRKAGFA